MKYEFPADYDQRTCYLVPINASLIPIVAGMLKHFEARGAWVSDSDYERGYNAIAELQAYFMKICVDDLIESNDRLYRMLSTALYGTQYTVQSTDPLVVLPELGPTHDLTIEDDRSLLGRMQVLQERLDNAMDGTITQHYDRPQGVRDLLEQLVTALEAQENLDPQMLARLIEIVGLLA